LAYSKDFSKFIVEQWFTAVFAYGPYFYLTDLMDHFLMLTPHELVETALHTGGIA